MFLSEPGRTPYDMEFSCFGFPIRVHPAFFVMPLLLGSGFRHLADVNTGVAMVFIVLMFFVSILVHELGHAIAFRYYRKPCRIVLYWMGGLAIPDSGNVWQSQSTGSLNPNQQIVVSVAGPVFGLLLAAVLILVTYLVGGTVQLNTMNFMPFPEPVFAGSLLEGSEIAFMVFFGGIILNIVLNLFNLVPIYPLDGGQIARQIMVQMDSFNGLRHSIILSIACAVLIAVVCFANDLKLLAFFLGFMAWSNFQSLQQYGGSRW